MKKLFLLFTTCIMLSTGAFAQVTIIDWGGQMVDANGDLPNPTITNVDIDGLNAIDKKSSIAFDETTPTQVSGGNYSTYEEPFHMAVLGYSLDGGGGFDDRRIINNVTTDYMYVRFQESTKAILKILILFHKKDFLVQGSNKVYLDSTCSFGVTFSQWENLDTLRWVVKDNGNYYVSKTLGFNLTIPNNLNDGEWARYNPADTLEFFDDTATFSPRTFTDITAVGILIDDDNWSATRRRFQMNTITINAKMSIEPVLSTPASGVYLRNDTINIAADVNSVNLITQVKFYDGTTLLATDATAPYSYQWIPTTTGARDVYAVVYDNLGDSAVSGVADVTVKDIVMTSPANFSVYNEGDSITFAADNGLSGPGLKVYFFANSTLVDSIMSEPFTKKWQVTQYGTYNLFAVATNSLAQVAYSDSIQVTVNNVAPTTAITFPKANDIFAYGDTILVTAEANAPYGTITKVEFRNASSSLYTDNASPWEYKFYDTIGNYQIRSRCTDDANVNISGNLVSYKIVAFDVPVSPLTKQVIDLNVGTTGSNIVATPNITYTNGITYRWLWGTDSAVYNNVVTGETDSIYLPDFNTVDTLWVVCEFTRNSVADTSLPIKIEVINTVTSTPEVESNSIAVYPNPAKDIVTITGIENATVEVLDMSLSLVNVFLNVNNQLDLSGLASGVYVLKITEDNKVVTKQITIVK